MYTRSDQTQSGYGMVLALVMVSVIAGLVLVMFQDDQEDVRLQEAQSAAWHFTTVAKAARIYVRNNSLPPLDVDGDGNLDRIDGGNVDVDADNVADILGRNADGVWDDTFSAAALLADPDNIIPIPFNALMDDVDPIPGDPNLLAPSFSPTNIYGQTVQIFAAFYPLGALPPAAVPAAYVYLNPGPNPRPANMALLAQEAEKYGGFFNSPVFNNLGVNVSDDCDGDLQPNIVSWDGVNCIDSGDFAGIAATGVGAFTSGALFAPAWRMALHDTRALMRFGQQDNANATQMQANMRFGQEVLTLGGCAQIDTFTPDTAGTFVDTNGNTYNQNPSTLCQVLDDNNLATGQLQRDRRVNIENVGSIQNITEIILTNQASDVLYDELGTDITPAEEVSLAGSPVNEVLTLGNTGTTIFGDLNSSSDIHFTNRIGNPHPLANYVPTVSFRDSADILTDLDVDHTIDLNNTSLSNLSISIGTTADVNAVVTAQNITSTVLEVDMTNVGGLLDAVGGEISEIVVQPAGDGIIVNNDLRVDGALISNNVGISDDMNAQNMNVTGASLVSGNSIQTGDLDVDNDARLTTNVNVDSRIRVNDYTNARDDTFINNCFGDCPDITE